MEEVDIGRVMSAFAVVIGLLGLWWLAIRWRQGNLNWKMVSPLRPQQRIHLEEIRSLDARNRLILVRCGEEHMLLCLHPQGCSLLAQGPQLGRLPGSLPSGIASEGMEKPI